MTHLKNDCGFTFCHGTQFLSVIDGFFSIKRLWSGVIDWDYSFVSDDKWCHTFLIRNCQCLPFAFQERCIKNLVRLFAVGNTAKFHLWWYFRVDISNEAQDYEAENKNVFPVKMKAVGTSKPKKHANKFGKRPKMKQTTSIYPYISTYTAIKPNTKSCTYVGLYGSDLF